MMESLTKKTFKSKTTPAKTGLLLCLGVFYAGYMVIRYGGLWSENDTAIFTHDAILTVHYHTMFFPTQYPHGFGYQTWLAMLTLTTRLPAGFINTTILPFIGVILASILALTTYHELTNNRPLSELTILLLLAVPGILFTLLRGNHEKLTIDFILAGILALSRTLKSSNPKEEITWEIVFYALMAANGAVNDYFTVMLVWGMVAFLIVGGIFSWRTGFPNRHTFMVILRMLVISLTIIMGDVWLVFPPARTDAHLLIQTLQRVKILFTTQQIASNPLSAPVAQWIDIPVYLVVSAFRWIVIFGSLIIWLIVMLVPLRRKEPLPLQTLILSSMYAATAMLVVIAVPIDLSGLAAGSNLEVRNYTYFGLFALPFVAVGSSHLLEVVRKLRYQKLAGLVLATAMGFFIAMSMLKATLDPLISNQWLFFSPGEKQAVLFYLGHRHNGLLWAGPDQRLRNAAATWWPGTNPWTVDGGAPPTASVFSLWLWSPNLAQDSVELGDPLPNFQAENLIYTNGQAKIYAAIPTSPFELNP